MKFKKTSNKINRLPQVNEIIFLIIIFTVSMLIRIIGVKHGFPLLTHPDEGFSLVPVLNMTQNRTLNPGIFNRPNQILSVLNFFYLNFMSYLRFGENMAVAYPKNDLVFHHDARLLISFMGSFIPIVAYKMGKLFKPKYAFAAALVFAFFPSYLLHSLFITPDIPITLFTLLVIYFTLRYLKKNERNSLCIAILFAAINTAEKYPGLISLGIVFFGIVLDLLENHSFSFTTHFWPLTKRLLGVLCGFLVALFFVAPFLFIKHQHVIEALAFESRASHLGADNLGWGGNLIFYIQAYASWTNILSLIFISIGAFALIKWRTKESLLLFYGILYWILLSTLPLHWERWGLPMYITPLFLTAIGIAYLWEKTKTQPIFKFISILLTIVFFSQQFIATLHTSVRMAFTDTRVAAKEYCDQNAITKNNSLYEGYTPFHPMGPRSIFDEDINNHANFSYFILSSQMYGRYLNEPLRYSGQVQFYENIRKEHQLIAKFVPEPPPARFLDLLNDITFYFQRQFQENFNDRFTGPIIEIYRVGD